VYTSRDLAVAIYADRVQKDSACAWRGIIPRSRGNRDTRGLCVILSASRILWYASGCSCDSLINASLWCCVRVVILILLITCCLLRHYYRCHWTFIVSLLLLLSFIVKRETHRPLTMYAQCRETETRSSEKSRSYFAALYFPCDRLSLYFLSRDVWYIWIIYFSLSSVRYHEFHRIIWMQSLV